MSDLEVAFDASELDGNPTSVTTIGVNGVGCDTRGMMARKPGIDDEDDDRDTEPDGWLMPEWE